MFNNIVQPTGVYGPFQTPWANNNNKQAFSKFSIKDPEKEAIKQDANKPIEKKQQTVFSKIAPLLAFALVASISIVCGIPAIRDKFKCFEPKNLEKPAKPILGSETLGKISKGAKKNFVACADFIEAKFQVPFRRFLNDNVFCFMNLRNYVK